jgi:ribose transport system permease protein
METIYKSKSRFYYDTAPVVIFLVIMFGIMAIFTNLNDQFLTLNNFLRALKHLSITSLTALGLMFVVVVGFSDMSFHFVSCFSAMTMSFLIGMGVSPVPSILAGLLAGLFYGLINGYMVGKLRLPDMIATIAIGSVAWGTAYLFSRGNYIYKNFLTSGIITFSDGKFFGIPFPVIYLFTFYILAFILLHRTKYGRHFYATGSNRVAAQFSGIKVERYIITAFAISCAMASFTNMIMTAAQGNGNVKGGLVLLMPAYAAIFVGISVFKKPTVIGTFLGAFLISMMQNGFTLLNAPFYIMDLIVGATLILSIMISRIDIKQKQKQTLLSSASAKLEPQ